MEIKNLWNLRGKKTKKRNMDKVHFTKNYITLKHIERYSTFLIRKMQFKAIPRYYFWPIRLAKISTPTEGIYYNRNNIHIYLLI